MASATTRKAPSVQQLRIACAALLLGPLLLAAVVAWILYGTDGPFPTGDGGVISVIAAASIVLFAPFGYALRRAVWRRVQRFGDPIEQRAHYATGVLSLVAMLEATILFNLLAWLVSGEPMPALAIVFVAYVLALTALPSERQLQDLLT